MIKEVDILKISKEACGLACDFLEITPPKIVKGDDFPTPTTRMAIEVTKTKRELKLNIGAIQKYDKSEFDVFAEAFHECRHLYQIDQAHSDNPIEPLERVKDWRQGFSIYKQSDEIKTTDYNSQEIEIDAFAFASVMMQIYFKVIMTFDFDKQLESKVDERAKQLLLEYKQRGFIS